MEKSSDCYPEKIEKMETLPLDLPKSEKTYQMFPRNFLPFSKITAAGKEWHII